eukprot:2041553-Prymnesium_polylepis.1
MLIACVEAGGTGGGDTAGPQRFHCGARLAASRHHGARPNTPTPRRPPRAIAAESRAATLPTHHPRAAQGPGAVVVLAPSLRRGARGA